MFSLNLNTVGNVSQGLACTLIGYGMSRYVTNNLQTDKCTKVNLNLGISAMMLNGVILVSKQLF